MKQEMLINVAQPEECRIAIVEDGSLEELYIERTSQDNYVGNIYKGVVVNLEPSIQAAFVDFGVGRNGFLHISDVEPQYFRQGGYDPDKPIEPAGPRRRRGTTANRPTTTSSTKAATKTRPGRRGRTGSAPGGRPRFKPPIQEILRRGDEVLVQVIKEGIGTKGPTLSTYISIPGRYLVLMPALGRIGVSRKIEDDDVRRRLRDIMLELNPPKGLGFIVRTAGIDRTKHELSRDLAYLLRLWKVIVRRIKKLPGPVDIYEESDMIIRTIRDIFTADVDAIYIDEPTAYERAKEFLQLVMPRYVNRLQLYEGKEPLFHKYNLDEEIAKIHQPPGAAAAGRLDRHRPDRGPGGHRRQQRQLPRRRHGRGNRLPDEPAGRQGDRPAAPAPRPGRRDRQRLHRHAQGEAPPRRRAGPARRREARPGPDQDPPHQPLRPDRNDPAADPPQPEAQRVQGLPVLRGQRRGEDGREHGDRGRAAADPGHPARGRGQGDRHRGRRRGDYLNNQKRRELSRLEDENTISVQIFGIEGVSPEHLVLECHDTQGRELKIPVPSPRPGPGRSLN